MSIEPWQKPLYDASGMRAIDAWAIEERGVPSLDLMERAGAALATHAAELAPHGAIACVCGSGNNGGDGLVAARHLRSWGHDVSVLLLASPERLAADAARNLERLEGGHEVVDAGRLAERLEGVSLVVDAILGTGFAGEPREPAAGAIERINSSAARVVAADIASGVDASSGAIASLAVRAERTVAFHAAKVGHLVAPGKVATGDLFVAEIGIPPGAPAGPVAALVTEGVLGLKRHRTRESTKFSAGSVVVVGGSPGLTGAVALCARAAARAGAGYVTACIPSGLEPVLEAKLTEMMTLGVGPPGARRLGADDSEPVLEAAARADAVVVGPGLGRGGDEPELVRALLADVEAPLVIDADGLGALARLEQAPRREGALVLTPHGGELARLVGASGDEVRARRLACAREAAARHGATVVLKGDDTLLVTAGEGEGEATVAVADVDSPALATAGTGDVLAGAIGAALADALEPPVACALAVELHARAGRLAASRAGSTEGVLAGDVAEALPAAIGGGGGA